MPAVARSSMAIAMIAVATLAAGCGDNSFEAEGAWPARQEPLDPSVAQALREPVVRRMRRGCPVTRPNHSVPPEERVPAGKSANAYYGNGRLWTVLWPQGVLVAGRDAIAPDGSISMKLPWWRGGKGRLEITGRSIDHGGPAVLRAHVPAGYGPTGFQSSAVTFSREGCWQVTGSTRAATLSFVTLVVKARAR